MSQRVRVEFKKGLIEEREQQLKTKEKLTRQEENDDQCELSWLDDGQVTVHERWQSKFNRARDYGDDNNSSPLRTVSLAVTMATERQVEPTRSFSGLWIDATDAATDATSDAIWTNAAATAFVNSRITFHNSD